MQFLSTQAAEKEVCVCWFTSPLVLLPHMPVVCGLLVETFITNVAYKRSYIDFTCNDMCFVLSNLAKALSTFRTFLFFRQFDVMVLEVVHIDISLFIQAKMTVPYQAVIVISPFVLPAEAAPQGIPFRTDFATVLPVPLFFAFHWFNPV